MPYYDFKCSFCQSEWLEQETKVEVCPLCEHQDTPFRVVNFGINVSNSNTSTDQKKEKPGELTKKFIDEAKKELKQFKRGNNV